MYIIIDRLTPKGYVVSDTTGAAKIVGVSRNTMRNWMKPSDYKETEEFIIIKDPRIVKFLRGPGYFSFAQ